jgi:AcrR family transcriptional regulator
MSSRPTNKPMERPPRKRSSTAVASRTSPGGKAAGPASSITSIAPDRRADLIVKAAALFGARGYDNTSMRDIAVEFGILHGSLYYHFGSKEELFITVYAEGVSTFIKAVQDAIAPLTDPWGRLEAACVAHLEALLTRASPAATVLADWSSTYTDSMREALVRERDRYEGIFQELTDAVDLPAGIRRRYFRLGLLGALNGALTWHQPGRDSPATVARHIFALFHTPAPATERS